MNRLQKKCIIVSLTLHGLLILILLFGAALMPSPDEQNTFKPITVYSADKVSDALSRGGDPTVAVTPAPPKPLPPVQPPPQPVAKTEPPTPKPRVVEQAKPRELEVEKPKVEPKDTPQEHWYSLKWAKTKPVEDAKEEVAPTPKEHHKIVIDPTSLKQTTRKSKDTVKDAAKDNEETDDRAARNARRRQAQEFAKTFRSINQNLSSGGVQIHTTPGVGGGGEANVNYSQLIFSKYDNAWVAPAVLEDSTPVVTVQITIARDGNVTNYRILKSSGNRIMDKSVRSALENVTFIEPFPASFKESERTFTIEFNLQAKRQTG